VFFASIIAPAGSAFATYISSVKKQGDHEAIADQYVVCTPSWKPATSAPPRVSGGRSQRIAGPPVRHETKSRVAAARGPPSSAFGCANPPHSEAPRVSGASKKGPVGAAGLTGSRARPSRRPLCLAARDEGAGWRAISIVPGGLVQFGRNRDRHCERSVSVRGNEGAPMFLWIATSREPLLAMTVSFPFSLDF